MNALLGLVWFKSVLVTSCVCLILGWVLQNLWRQHAARAYQMLLLFVLAAVCVPILGLAVHEFNMGVLPAEAQILAMPAWLDLSSARSTPSSIPEAVVSTSSQRATPQLPPQSSPIEVKRMPLEFLAHFTGWIWPLITIAFLLRVAVAFVRGVFRVKRAQAVEALPNGVDLPGLKASLGIKRPVIVAVSDTASCPVIWCWAGAITIVVPLEFLEQHSDSDLNAVFCHELAHAKRRDYVSGLLSELAVCCMPWQPLMWWAKQRLVTLSEHACDDWVVACGTQEVDYAASLLDMHPQGEFAFTPAVATRQSSLAVRIKRILALQCGNPYQGRAWSCLAASLVLLISFGVAFAQVKEVASNGGSEHQCKFELCQNEKYHHYEAAVHGTVVDPNGDPVSDALVTVLPMTGFPAETDAEGHFTEIPYARDWCVNGSVTLLARDKENNWAASARVVYPENNVTIHLREGTIVSGKVVDVGGKPVPNAQVWLDWKGSYNCPMPVCYGRTGEQGSFSLVAVPSNQDYTLTVHADNYQLKSKVVSLHTRNLQDPNIILPEIVVPSGLPSETYAQAVSTWKDSFDAVYSLHEDEAAKFIKAPFILERQHFSLNNQWHFLNAVKNRFYESHQNQFLHFIFAWDRGLVDSSCCG